MLNLIKRTRFICRTNNYTTKETRIEIKSLVTKIVKIIPYYIPFYPRPTYMFTRHDWLHLSPKSSDTPIIAQYREALCQKVYQCQHNNMTIYCSSSHYWPGNMSRIAIIMYGINHVIYLSNIELLFPFFIILFVYVIYAEEHQSGMHLHRMVTTFIKDERVIFVKNKVQEKI
jgi:hypothetical protein